MIRVTLNVEVGRGYQVPLGVAQVMEWVACWRADDPCLKITHIPAPFPSQDCIAVSFNMRDSIQGRIESVVSILSKQLRQECIAVAAVYPDGRQAGFLAGPQSEKWQPFDPSKFIFP